MADWKKAAVNGTAELRPWIQAYDWLDHPYGREPGDGAGGWRARLHEARVPALEPEGVVPREHARVPRRRAVSGAEDRARALGLVIPDFHADGYYGGDFGSMKSHHS